MSQTIKQIFSYVNAKTIETFIDIVNGQRKVLEMAKLIAVKHGHLDILMYILRQEAARNNHNHILQSSQQILNLETHVIQTFKS